MLSIFVKAGFTALIPKAEFWQLTKMQVKMTFTVVTTVTRMQTKVDAATNIA